MVRIIKSDDIKYIIKFKIIIYQVKAYMLSSNFDFQDTIFQNISFPFFTSNADYNIRNHLQNIKYEFPLNESLLEEPEIENDIFKSNSLFDDDYSSTFLSSIFEEKSNSITLDEYKEKIIEVKKEIKAKEKFDEINSSNSIISTDSFNTKDKTSLNEAQKEKKRLIFGVVYNKKISLFSKISQTNLNNDEKFNLFKSINEETLNKKRKIKRRRRENRDNIRKKIKCGFFNGSLIKILNKKLKSIGNRLFFEKFGQKFVSDVGKKSNKDILNLSLNEIFEKKELYKEKEYSCYYHNLKVVKNEEIKNNYLMRQILDMTYSQLYEDYINSDEFIDEVNRLKKIGMSDEYINNYLYLSKHFIEFIQN